MGIGVGTAILISGGAGGIQKRQQDDANEKAQAEQLRLEEQAREQEQQILLEQAESENEPAFEYGTGDDEELGSYNEFLTPTKTSGIQGTKPTQSVSTLGF